MSHLASLWQAFITRPLWVHVAVQSCLIGAGAVLGYYSVIQKERILAEDVRQNIRQVTAETIQIAQRLQALPPLSALARQLTSLEHQPTAVENDGVAALLAQPLAQSGATLVSLQQHHSFVTPAGNAPREPLPPTRWVLLVSTDYHNALILLHQMMALSQPLHIHSLSINAKSVGMLVEITLSLPRVSEDKRA